MKNIDRDFLDKELSRRGQVNLDDLELEKLEIDGLDLDNLDFDNMDFDEMLEIGGMIEKALDTEEFHEIEDLIEMPSKETFQEWIELGEQKYRKRVRRKRILSACAAVLIICIGAVAAINCFKPPTVEAGLDGGIQIDDSMDRTTTYETWADLPADIQDTFLEIKDLPEGYEIEKIEVTEGTLIMKVEYYILTEGCEYIIRESINLEGGMTNNLVAGNNSIMSIRGLDVFVEDISGVDAITYKCVIADIMLDIVCPREDDKYLLDEVIKVVQKENGPN